MKNCISKTNKKRKKIKKKNVNCYLPGTGINSLCSVHRGQHSLGWSFCFEMGHCRTGHVFLAHFNWLPAHWHTKQRSSIEATTSWPSKTICPLILQPFFWYYCCCCCGCSSCRHKWKGKEQKQKNIETEIKTRTLNSKRI